MKPREILNMWTDLNNRQINKCLDDFRKWIEGRKKLECLKVNCSCEHCTHNKPLDDLLKDLGDKNV